jgi:type IV secretion system protein VirB9
MMVRGRVQSAGIIVAIAAGVAMVLALPGVAHAQIAPTPTQDPRMAVVHADGQTPIALTLVPGRDLTVFIPAGEHVQGVTVGDSGSLHVAVPDSQDGIVLSALHAVSGVSLSVRTERQTYGFAVTAAFTGTAPWLVRIESGGPSYAPPPIWTPPVFRAPGTWKLNGDKALQPKSIRDDGLKTYIEWGPDQSLPAVFGIGATGSEEMVDGWVRQGTFVIDRVYPALVFRIDKAEASAKRSEIKAPHK